MSKILYPWKTQKENNTNAHQQQSSNKFHYIYTTKYHMAVGNHETITSQNNLEEYQKHNIV